MELHSANTLPAGVDLRTTTFRIIKDGVTNSIGAILHDSSGNTYTIPDANFQTRFNISRSEMATLIIKKVSEREEAVYQCELTTTTLNIWTYNIRVIVTGKNFNVQIVYDKRSQSINV